MNTNHTPQKDSDDLEQLREIRRKITASFGHDQKKIGDYLREREKTMGDRIVRTQDRLVPAKKQRAIDLMKNKDIPVVNG